MSKKPRQSYIGCSLVTQRGNLFLQARPRDATGRKVVTRWPTGLPALGEEARANRTRLEPLRVLIAACVRAGRSPSEIDTVLAGALPRRRSERAEQCAATLQPALTVRARYESWIAEQIPPLVRPALARDYRRHFAAYILPSLGDLPLAAVRPKDVRALQAELLARGHVRRKGRKTTGKLLAVKTVKNAIAGSLRAFWRAVLADELATVDIFAGLIWPKATLPEPDPFTIDEVRRIEAWFRAHRFGFPPRAGSRGIHRQPHPPFHAYVHTLFWTGLRPSEASGLQAQDLDLSEVTHGRLYVRRSYHLYRYQAPKTSSARRTVELFQETVQVLRAILPLHVTPETPVFTTTDGRPIEPKTFSEHWYRCLRALNIRTRGLYCTKDTYVSHALQKVGSVGWVEQQTGVAYATLKKHYARWLPNQERVELRRFTEAIAAEARLQSA